MPKLPYSFVVPSVSPDTFARIVATVRGTSGVVVTMSGQFSGTVRTPDISFGFIYDNGSLNINVTNTNDFKAKLASNSMIEQHIRGLIAQA